MIIIESINTVIDAIPPICWIGGGVFIMSIVYVIWLWRQRF